jgi:hypothetical protein
MDVAGFQEPENDCVKLTGGCSLNVKEKENESASTSQDRSM